MVDPAGPAISATTRLAAVIGSPVRHSRSPRLANAAFAAAGLDWAMVALPVAAGGAGAAIAAVRALDLGGLMVTMPLKAEVVEHLDGLTPAARALGVVNSVAWEDGRLIGDNTDGPGLVASLRRDVGVDPAGMRCVVVGAGGAARSVAWALADAGVADLAVVNRSEGPAREAAAIAGAVGRVATAAEVAAADLVVNATSVGMGAADGDDGPVPFDVELLVPGQLVVDLVYQPLVTPLLREAGARGARPLDGLGMLVHQAALTIRRWTGVDPDVEVMSAAVRHPG